MRSLSPTLTLLGDDNPPRTCDFQCALMSLPLLFGTTLQTVPAFERYLAPEAERLERMAHLLGPRTRPRVGLAWSGNSANKNDLFRSIAFARLAPLFGGEIEWIVAQNVVRPSDAPALAESPEVRFLGHELADFADTAALVAQCDLVISADTSIAHLAGALGKPVWVLLPLGCDWRWLKDRSDSPWYPTARLFRQPRLGDWESVVDAARRALPAALGVGLA